MKTKTSSPAFTLIELLVVITIIGILMGLLFPVFGAVRESAKKTQAANDENQIVTAVKAYYTEYGKYPLTDAQATAAADVIFGQPGGGNPNGVLFNSLRGVDYTQIPNPRQIVFIEARDAKSATNPTGGIATADATVGGTSIKKGDWCDPWGTPYVVFIDGNYDNQITGVSTVYSSVTTANAPRVGVGVASMGKDLKAGKAGDGKIAGTDDVVSWR